MQLFCQKCGEPLRGQQRKWCSKSCKDWGVRQAPGYQEKRREWDREYHQTEGYKAKRAKREQSPRYKAAARERMKTPEAKARCRERQRTPEYKTQASLRQHLRRQTPEGKAKRRDHKHQRRARHFSVPTERLPIGWTKQQYANQEGRCYLCGEPMSFSGHPRSHCASFSGWPAFSKQSGAGTWPMQFLQRGKDTGGIS